MIIDRLINITLNENSLLLNNQQPSNLPEAFGN
jgi:hypothetical protein